MLVLSTNDSLPYGPPASTEAINGLFIFDTCSCVRFIKSYSM